MGFFASICLAFVIVAIIRHFEDKSEREKAQLEILRKLAKDKANEAPKRYRY